MHFFFKSIFQRTFLLFYNMLCWLLLYNNVSQQYGHLLPSLLDFPPTPPPPSHFTHLCKHRAPSWAPCARQQLPTSYYFTQGRIYMSIIVSQFIPPSSSPPVSTSPFFTSSSLFLPCKQVHQYIFQRVQRKQVILSPLVEPFRADLRCIIRTIIFPGEFRKEC